ncbi:MAG: amidohydrolase [Oscillospiraceae bacterium]|nr:amidohydrolase [Oscillospiraceae bacterium]
MDTLFRNVTAVTLDKYCSVLQNAYVGVETGRICYLGKTPPAPEAVGTARVIDGRGKALLPGLINAHTHLPMTLLRGYADDADLRHWLFDHVFPAEARMDGRAVRAGTLLALAEALASGTVSVSDMYDHCGDIAACVAQSGLKANLSRGVVCPDGNFDPKTHVGCREAKELVEAWHGYDEGRIQAEVSIHAEYTSPPPLWETLAALAREQGVGMHLHLSETHREHDECLERHGLTPTAVFDRYGVFGTRATAAHGVWLTDEDMDLLAARGASVVHCPVSNLKLASGVARLTELTARGVNVALGTDGAASNNTLDMWEEIKTACLLAKNRAGAPEAFTAPQAFALAVTGGAKAQGREGETGRIEPGLDADLILVDFTRPHLTPCHNHISHLAYAVRGGDVTLTMVRGRVLYENGVFTTIDLERARYETEAYALPKIMG